MKLRCIFGVLSVMILLLAGEANAQEIILPKFIGDGMVIQRETKAPVWGWTKADATVEIVASWDNRTVKATADAKGKFTALLATPAAGGPYTIKFTVNSKVKEVTDVMVGEVWLCSGQSNMKFRLGGAEMWRVQGDNNPNIRFFEVNLSRSATAQDTIKGGVWRYGVVPGNMQHISAVGYYFARRLQEQLGIPVGVIGSYEGGTNVEEWTNPAIMKTMPEVDAAYIPKDEDKRSGCLYNAMIYPLLPYKISGILWYQGENNVARIQHYDKNLKAMVTGWRSDFENKSLPFYLVQLPAFSGQWMEFREVQEGVSKTLKNAGLAVTIDTGEIDNIHPAKKKPAGDRLADIALAKVYGKKEIPFSSPLYKKSKVEGSNMRIYFDFADDGLKIVAGEQPQLFEVAGSDGVYHAADARIEGNTVLIWSNAVKQPVSARYYWKNFAIPNLFSTAGLPVAPFRTEKK